MNRRISALTVVLAIAFPSGLLAQRCGVERWSVKTGTDADAASVDLANPKPATIAGLIGLTPPSPVPKDSRVGPTETSVFVVNATLTDFKLETGKTGDSDYHLVLEDDQGHTMVAEIPSPHCVDDSSPFASQIAAARAKFDSQFTATSSFQTANVPVQITGVGFFDFFHNQHGAAPNVIELHPVLDISFDTTPPGSDFSLNAPAAIHIVQGGTRSVQIAASSAGGAPNLAIATSGLPAGVSAHVDPAGKGKATLTLNAAAGALIGTFPFTVTGTANGISRNQVLSLNVTGSAPTGETTDWEYRMISAASEDDILKQANQLGADGWEMVGVVKVTGSPAWRAFFKRVKRDF